MKQFCNCGGIILADTEDWENPLCYSCFMDTVEKAKNYQALLAEANKMREILITYKEKDFGRFNAFGDLHNVQVSLAGMAIAHFDKFLSEIKERE